jgi:hypothetical protein
MSTEEKRMFGINYATNVCRSKQSTGGFLLCKADPDYLQVYLHLEIPLQNLVLGRIFSSIERAISS